MVHGARLHVNLLLINKAFLSTSSSSSDTTATPPSIMPEMEEASGVTRRYPKYDLQDEQNGEHGVATLFTRDASNPS
jgi:hypothetical protein